MIIPEEKRWDTGDFVKYQADKSPDLRLFPFQLKPALQLILFRIS